MKKISVSIDGHRTSVSLENEFAAELARIASAQNKSVAKIIYEIDAANANPNTNLSSAIRVWILRRLQESK